MPKHSGDETIVRRTFIFCTEQGYSASFCGTGAFSESMDQLIYLGTP
jgi:hypothetical protein